MDEFKFDSEELNELINEYLLTVVKTPHFQIFSMTVPRNAYIPTERIGRKLEQMFGTDKVSFSEYYHPVVTAPYSYLSWYVKKEDLQ